MKSRRYTSNLNIYRWKSRIEYEGPTATLRFELRELLAPKIALKQLSHWHEDESKAEVPERLTQLIDWELVLAADHVHSSLRDLVNAAHWPGVLPALLHDLQQLLHDALDLLRELGAGDDRNDRSHWHLPSISPHFQNRDHDWVALIELLRDAWVAIREIDLARATQIAKRWFAIPYPTFKRLALFAASHDNCIAPDQWVNWLVADDTWWLWSDETKRETLRLLVLQGSHLTPQAREQLEATILIGPPRAMYRDDIAPERLQSRVDHSIWLYLAKLQSSGADLSPAAAERLAALFTAHTEWRIANNESDEFLSWMSMTGDPDFESSRTVSLAPRKRSELVEWLKQKRSFKRSFHEDIWRETCRTRFFHSVLALCDLANAEQWPTDCWGEALQTWSHEELALRSWRFIARLVYTMPSDFLKDIAYNITWWLRAVSRSLDRHDGIFLGLCQRILDLPHQSSVGIDQSPVTQAFNHPIGHVTQALLNLWFKQGLNDNDRLPTDLEPFFTKLCNTNEVQFRYGRVLLAQHLITLFRVDRPWTEAHLLPLFNWQTNVDEACAVWEGFLLSPRLYHPLLVAFKSQFLDTANHYTKLGEYAQQFAALLTRAGLERMDNYTLRDFQIALGKLPPPGLQEAAQALVHALQGAGEQREDYWVNRIAPFWQCAWPKSCQLASKDLAETLAQLSIAARGQFPAALDIVLHWLQPIKHLDYVVHLLHESGLSKLFPQDTLCLLNAIIDSQQLVLQDELKQCLMAISEAAPNLQQDARHQRLLQYLQRWSTL